METTLTPHPHITQARLSPSQFAYLDAIADRTGGSKSELLRLLVAADMARSADALGQREQLEERTDAGIVDDDLSFARSLAAAWDVDGLVADHS